MNWWGVEWVSLFQHLMALLQVWNGNNFKNLERLCWQACFYAVVWSIWLARNEIVFENKNMDKEEIVDLAKTRKAPGLKGNTRLITLLR